MTKLYCRTWSRTELIMDTFWQRVRYMLRVNPLFLQMWWVFWAVPLKIGYRMYRKNLGLVWERTLKKDDTVAVGTRNPLYDWDEGRGPDGLKQDQKGRLYVAGGLVADLNSLLNQNNRPGRLTVDDEHDAGGTHNQAALTTFGNLPPGTSLQR